MGNYCCSDDELPELRSLKMRKKTSLNDPIAKRDYQEKINSLINSALEKFNGQKKVKEVVIKKKIGKGGQGSVFLVNLTTEDKHGDEEKKDYAMKQVYKKNLHLQRAKCSLMLENYILSRNQSPFLTQIYYAYQDCAYLYYIMDVAIGGDIFSYINQNCQFNHKLLQFDALGENGVRFIIAAVILALQYLHKQNIIYRDLKPQNILVYEDGYPQLSDFGICKQQNQNEHLCFETRGTVIYFSPEMALKKGYNKAHDLWTIGVLTYQLYFKKTPFTDTMIKSKNYEVFARQWEKSPKFDSRSATPQFYDFIKSLLKVNPKSRLGYNSITELKSHSFFNDFNWQGYQRKQIKSPLKKIVQQYPMHLQFQNYGLDEVIEQHSYQNIPFTYVKQVCNSERDMETRHKTYSDEQEKSL